ncbi:MAG: AarF/UbiB family protein, partial [Minwuiales bacterium]|nr:AarF/UbiB family protein [Minwuiales bacterium]
MLRAVRHIRRLIGIARTLARHDALFPLDMLEAPSPAIALVKLFAGRVRPQPDKRPGERLAVALHELGPSFIKLGQALSVRADLIGDEMANDLGELRDRLPAFPGAAARATISAELGKPMDALFESFEDSPVAAASIAQVHFAVTVGDGEPGENVAVKVLRPDIEAAFQRDLALFFWLAQVAERAEPKLRRLRPVDVVQTLHDSVAIE